LLNSDTLLTPSSLLIPAAFTSVDTGKFNLPNASCFAELFTLSLVEEIGAVVRPKTPPTRHLIPESSADT
jgi:hypothetical protein